MRGVKGRNTRIYIPRTLSFLVPVVGFFVTAVFGQAPAGDAELQRILSRTRDTYTTAAAWHFEHRISIEETDGSGSAVKLADVSLVTANRVSPGRPAGVTAASICTERCRLSSTAMDQGTMLVVRDGTNVWKYSSTRVEYMKGATVRDIAMSVPAALLVGTHVETLGGLEGGVWSDVRQLGNEVVEIGGVRRDSYVVEATLKTNGLRLDAVVRGERPPPDLNPLSTPSGLLSLLQLQGLATVQFPSAYFAADGAPPAKVRMWIDQQSYLILRRTATQTTAKLELSREPPAGPPTAVLPPTREVTLRLDDTFSQAEVADAVGNALFTFNPPDGSREVPNIRATVPGAPPSGMPLPQGALELVRSADVWAFYRQQPDTLIVTIETPLGWTTQLAVDVNQDGKKEPPDFEFQKGDNNRLCKANVIGPGEKSECTSSTSKATVQVLTATSKQLIHWVIPKTELSADGKSVRFEIWIGNGSELYRLGVPYPYLVIFSSN